MNKDERSPLKGIILPLISPMNEALEPDLEALRRLIRFVIREGASGVFLFGTSGEAVGVTHGFQDAMIEVALQECADRVPALVGAVEPSTARTIERLKRLEQLGAQYVVATPPFYVAISCQDELIRHYEAICKAATAKVVAYNIPSTTHVNLRPETLSRIAQFDNLAAYKDSCADFEQIQRDISALRGTGVSLLNGAEELCAASMLLGANGCVPGIANFVPQLFVRLCRACAARDIDLAKALQEEINGVRRFLNAGKSWISAMKYAGMRFGFGAGGAALPIEPLTEAQRREVETILAPYLPDAR